MSGAMEMAKSDLMSGNMSAGDTKTYYVGGSAISVSAVDNSANAANTVVLTANGAPGKGEQSNNSSKKTVAVVPTSLNNIWSYGLYSNGGFTWPSLGLSKVVGSVYFRNSISVLGTGGQISKDFKTSSSFNPLSVLKISGAILTGVSPLSFPSLSTSTYTAAADSVLTGNQTLTGYTFPTDNALVVVNGNLTFHGTVTRQGTIYVTGTVLINGNVTLQSSSKKLLIITPNGITFNGSGTALTADGYYFAGGTITISDSLTNTGALVGNNFSVASSFTENWDQWLTQKAANGQVMSAPGMWP
jgi:hypothetical protein